MQFLDVLCFESLGMKYFMLTRVGQSTVCGPYKRRESLLGDVFPAVGNVIQEIFHPQSIDHSIRVKVTTITSLAEMGEAAFFLQVNHGQIQRMDSELIYWVKARVDHLLDFYHPSAAA